MPTDAMIPLMGRPVPGPLEMIGGAQEIQMRQQQMQMQQIAMQTAQRAMQAQLQIADAMRQQGAINQDGSLNQNFVQQRLISQGFGDQLPPLMQHFAALEKTRAEINHLYSQSDVEQSTVAAKQADYLGRLAAINRALNYDPQNFQDLLTAGIAQRQISPIQGAMLLQQVRQNPERIQQIVDSAWRASPEQMKEESARITAEAAQQRAQTGASEFKARMTGAMPMTAGEKANLDEKIREYNEAAPLRKAQMVKDAAEAASASANAAEKRANLQFLDAMGLSGAPGGKGAQPDVRVNVKTGDGKTRNMTRSAALDYIKSVQAAGGTATIVP